MPLMIGGAVVLVVVLVLVLANRGSTPADASSRDEPAAKEPARQPPATTPVQLGAAKAGKTPDRPAPPLTTDTLQDLRDLLDRIKDLRNDAVKARTGEANHELARSKMGEAKQLLDQWKEKVEEPLAWQEYAQMEDWAQPAEYVTLERLYATFQRYENEVRKGGG